MKILCILTYERTGSGWLSGLFDTQNCISIHEIFSDDPLLWLAKCEQIFTKIYNIDSSLLNFLSSIYNYNNLFLDIATYNKLKNKIIDNNIYSEKTLQLFINLCKEHNINLVFKLFPQHLKYLNNSFLYNNIDYLILNYRQDLIKSYYSLEKARVSGIWFNDQNIRQKNQIDIEWNENLYKIYVNNTINSIRTLKNIYDNYKQNKFIISYEELHENKLCDTYLKKRNYIQNKLYNNDINMSLNNKEYFSKQNNNIIFNNQSDFIESLKTSNITKKICIPS
jgi:hypothetical protein